MREAELHDLLAFAAVAQTRSFRGAAATRGVAASGLSAAVRRLEERLGVRLLNRTTRSVAPTEAGARLLERLAPALGEVAAALDGVNEHRETPLGTLRLNVPHVVARLILPDLIHRFLAQHPGITVEVTAEDGFVDVLAQGYDAGVRYDERLEQDMIAVPIGPRIDRYVTVAAPAYLERHGCPNHPKDLVAHRVVRHRFLHGVSLPWEFERNGRVVKVSPPALLLTNSLELQRAIVASGLGIATTFEGFYRDLLKTGEVVEILASWSQRFSGPYLYYSSRRYLPAPLRAFVDFLKADAMDAMLEKPAARGARSGSRQTVKQRQQT